MKKCPVCQQEQVDKEALHCTECDSDLTAFSQLNQISENTNRLSKTIKVLFVVLLLVSVGWGFTYYNGSADDAVIIEETSPPANQAADEIEILEKTLAAKDEEITKLNNKLKELHATIESSVNDQTITDAEGTHKLHIVQAGESLWSISELYHGHGFKHHHIGSHNEISNPDHIQAGDTLEIQN
ncbi:MAG TPA: LysM peptidoglycan-binding domain-containing protein [Flavobacteriales bacterium]|nr:LysM peptidoglycan-binding domain-containing protein [Flavobacteriales bacterium]HIN40071.1 LysM peptidoglycan-binding domain-containing protein [Flavobacteriales bacterium]